MDTHEQPPTSSAAPRDPTWTRLEDELAWYSRKSQASQRIFKRTKLAQLIIGAAVPVVALVDLQPIVTASLAAVVVVLEGAQQLYQWQANWILYRSTAEALKHERFLYLAEAGPYGGSDRPDAHLISDRDAAPQWAEVTRTE